MNLRTVFRKKKRWEPQEWGRELRKVQPRRPVPVRPLSASRPDPAPALEPRNPSCRCQGPPRSGRSQPRLPRVWRPRPAHGGLPQVRPPRPSGCRKRPLRALPRLFRGLSRPKCEISVADSHRARVRGAMAPPGGPGLQRGSRDRPSPYIPRSSLLLTGLLASGPGTTCADLPLGGQRGPPCTGQQPFGVPLLGAPCGALAPSPFFDPSPKAVLQPPRPILRSSYDTRLSASSGPGIFPPSFTHCSRTLSRLHLPKCTVEIRCWFG